MTSNDRDIPARDALPEALRFGLRELRRDTPPARDLWPGVSARIAAQPLPLARQRPQPRRRLRRAVWLATAASVALAVAIGWQFHPAHAPSSAPSRDTMLVRQADAMTLEYDAALRELEAVTPIARSQDALKQLDRSAAEVRAALALDPDAIFLLERLRHVYARRLSLSQRLA